MTKTEYAEILKGDRWQALRKRHIEEFPECAQCRLPRWIAEIAYDQDLHVHHLSYAHLGTDDERMDLQTLCRRCHDIETFGVSNLRAPKSMTCVFCAEPHWNPREKMCSDCQLICTTGPRSTYEYLDRVLPSGELVWKDLLYGIRDFFSGREVLDELIRIEVLIEKRRSYKAVPVSDEEIPF